MVYIEYYYFLIKTFKKLTYIWDRLTRNIFLMKFLPVKILSKEIKLLWDNKVKYWGNLNLINSLS